MKRLLQYSFIALLAISCQNQNDDNQESSDSGNQGKKINSKAIAGGTFSLPIGDPVTTLDPKSILDLTSAQVSGQIFDGLVRYNTKTLEVEPDLAKSWTTSEDLKKYTFELRENVKFHSKDGSEGKKFTAEDFLASAKYYCTKDGESSSIAYKNVFNLIKGAKAFYEGDNEGISGITIENNKLTIELAEPNATFIHKIANIYASVLPKSVLKDGFQPIGTGAFKLKENNDKKVLLTKNENYFRKDEKGNKLPYLDTLNFVVTPSKHKQYKAFKDGEILLIDGLPINQVTEIMKNQKEALTSIPPKYQLINEPEFSTQYYSLNTDVPALSNKKVRQALNYAIDREKIVQRVLNNQAYEAGHYGIVPPLNILEGYNFDEIKKSGYSYQPKKAQELLKEAGYPNGEGFPSLTLEFNKGTIHSSVASEITQQLRKTLNVYVNIEGVSFKQKLDDAAYGRRDIFRQAWVGDYPSPETFLMNAYGGNVPADPEAYSYPNVTRYKSAEFDKLMDKASVTKDKKERYNLFVKAEKVMMEDAPFIILWYAENFKLVYSKVRNFHFNSLNYLDMTEVYIKEWTGQEYKKVHNIQ